MKFLVHGVSAVLLSSGLLLQESEAFTTKSPLVATRPKFGLAHKRANFLGPAKQLQREVLAVRSRKPTTSLFGFNLPPGKKDNELGDILKGVAGFALVVAFFASPLGGIVFGIFNSVLLLTILLPVVGTIGFQAWQYFNTVSGECPNCAAPSKVIKTSKDGESTPTVCFNCGAILQANYDNTGIDNITGKNSVMDDMSSPFGGSIFDILGAGGAPPGAGTSSTSYTSSTATTTTIVEEKERKPLPSRSKDAIIDVVIEDKDTNKPWQ